MEPLLFVFLGLAVLGLFFVNSRGRKQQAKQNEFRNSLGPGQQVMTSSGQLGTIVLVDGDAITIETTPGVHTRWVKAAIQEVPPQFSSVLTPTEPTDVTDEVESEIELEEPRDGDAGTGRTV
ncbi:preprotein translocase subunit YajC [Salana multivorans]